MSVKLSPDVLESCENKNLETILNEFDRGRKGCTCALHIEVLGAKTCRSKQQSVGVCMPKKWTDVYVIGLKLQ